MKWLWGEKKKEKTPIEFTSKQIPRTTRTRVIKLHLELAVEVPDGVELIDGILKLRNTFELPEGMSVKQANIAHIEILN